MGRLKKPASEKHKSLRQKIISSLLSSEAPLSTSQILVEVESHPFLRAEVGSRFFIKELERKMKRTTSSDEYPPNYARIGQLQCLAHILRDMEQSGFLSSTGRSQNRQWEPTEKAKECYDSEKAPQTKYPQFNLQKFLLQHLNDSKESQNIKVIAEAVEKQVPGLYINTIANTAVGLTKLKKAGLVMNTKKMWRVI